MSAEHNEAVVRRIYGEFLDELDPGAADELLNADVVLHGVAAFGDGYGRENVKEGFRAFLSGFAERHTEVEDVIARGDRIVVRHTHHLKHVDEVFGVPPTSRQLSVWGIDIFRLEDGRIAEWWVIDDTIGMMQQLGMAPERKARPKASIRRASQGRLEPWLVHSALFTGVRGREILRSSVLLSSVGLLGILQRPVGPASL